MRTRGFTLLEVMVSTTLLALLLIMGLSLLDTGSRTFYDGSVKQYGQMHAQKILDQIADDFRNSAAWDYFQVVPPSNHAPGSGGDTVTRLTKFYAAKAITSGFDPVNPSAPPAAGFTWAPLQAGSFGIAFLRVVGSAAATNVSGHPAYLVLDFEPKESPAAWPSNPADVNADGAAVADHQPGRMNDDPNRQYILYRTRIVKHRIMVERVRGIAAIKDDGADLWSLPAPPAPQRQIQAPPTGNPAPPTGLVTNAQLVVEIGDLGPDSTVLPPAVSEGYLTISAIPVPNTPTGVGVIDIHVVARGLVRKGKVNDVVTADLETQVSIPCAVPPS